MSDDHLSSKAVVCTAHLMMLQNPKALLTSARAWVDYLILIREWAEKQVVGGERIYWHSGFSVDKPEENDEEDDKGPSKLN